MLQLTRAEDAIIFYPHLQELARDIERCRTLSQQAREPQCMSLEGLPGAGKSTLVRDYAALHPAHNVEDRTIIPVFYMEMPSHATTKGTAEKMLDTLGDPLPYVGTQQRIDARLIKLIRACRVELIILDDFHHLIDTENGKVLSRVADWLKVLIKETAVPFLAVGIPGEVEKVLRANSQLSRLFAVRETICPFAWDWWDADVRKTFHGFVQYAEQSVGRTFALAEGITRDELLGRVHFATDGIVANIMNLLWGATLYANERQEPAMTLAGLESVFAKRLAKHLSPRPNPFLATHGISFNPPAPTPPPTARQGDPGRQGKSVAQVLRAG